MTNLMELIKYLQEHTQELGLDLELTSKLKIPQRFLQLNPNIQLSTAPVRKVELWLTPYMVLAAWIKPELKSDPIKNEVSISVTEIQKLELFKHDTSKDSDVINYFAVSIPKQEVSIPKQEVSIPKQEESNAICANQVVLDFLDKTNISNEVAPDTGTELVQSIVNKLKEQSIAVQANPISTYGNKRVIEQTQPLRETTLLHLDMYRKRKWRITGETWGQNQLQLSLFKEFFEKPGYIVNIKQLGYWALKYEESPDIWHSISVYECEGEYLLEVISRVETQKANKFHSLFLERFSDTAKTVKNGFIELVSAKLASQVETAICP